MHHFSTWYPGVGRSPVGAHPPFFHSLSHCLPLLSLLQRSPALEKEPHTADAVQRQGLLQPKATGDLGVLLPTNAKGDEGSLPPTKRGEACAVNNDLQQQSDGNEPRAVNNDLRIPQQKDNMDSISTHGNEDVSAQKTADYKDLLQNESRNPLGVNEHLQKLQQEEKAGSLLSPTQSGNAKREDSQALQQNTNLQAPEINEILPQKDHYIDYVDGPYYSGSVSPFDSAHSSLHVPKNRDQQNPNFLFSPRKVIEKFMLMIHETNMKTSWHIEFEALGMQLQDLPEAAFECHKILPENRDLYNEVHDLKEHIQAYCRVRSIIANQLIRKYFVDFIGETSDLLIANQPPLIQQFMAKPKVKMKTYLSNTCSQVLP